MSCNERCYFCYAGDYLNHNGPQLSKENIRPIIENFTQAGVFQLVLLGGEPFLYRHLPQLLDEVAKTHFIVSLSTNATVDREDIWERIIEYDVHLNISLHSVISDVGDRIVGRAGATRCVLARIERLIAAGHPPHASMVLTKDNLASAVDTIRCLVELGVDSLSIFHTAGLGYARRHPEKCVPFSVFASIFADAKAVADEAGIVITPVTNYPFLMKSPPRFSNMSLAPLLYGTTDGSRVLYVLNDGRALASLYGNPQDMTLGNVISEDLVDIWSNSLALDKIRSLQPRQACLSCRHYTYCRGGPLSNRAILESPTALPRCPVYDPHLALE